MKQRFGFSVGMGLMLLGMVLSGTVFPVNANDAWFAEYFNNVGLSGAPVMTRYEPRVRFDWGDGSPDETVPADNFSVRLTHDVWFEGGNYRFSFRADDGVRVWVGDRLVADKWYDGYAHWRSEDHFIPEGVHKVRVEYYERAGQAALELFWERVSSSASWRADYYDNPGFAGNPTITRNEAAIDFDWGASSPDPSIPDDHFTARWTRVLGLEAGTYRFYVSADDGIRVRVDNQTVVDAWQKQKLPNTSTGDVTLSAGQHTIVVEYFEEGGVAAAHVWWNKLGTFGAWEGRYFDNLDLRGGPALIRDDAEINFDWGEGAPSAWMPADNFSASWTRQIDFAPGLYRFNAKADDGVRLWIDEVSLHMNYWEPQDYKWNYQDWHYLEGPHTLRVEYFEQAGNARIQFWWDYAATVAAAQAMAPSPVYGFPTAATPPPTTPSAPAAPQPTVVESTELPGPWQGAYFRGRDLDEAPALTRTDDVIDFNWGWGAPDPELPKDDFAVRWTGTFVFEAGTYRFSTMTDDGVRLYVGDQRIIHSWRPMRGQRYATIELTEGEHTVRVEYFERSQAAKARVTWARVGAPTPSVEPAAQGAPGPWEIRYYDNADLSGTPVLVQTDQEVPLDYDWGLGAPNANLPRDNFSASWEQTRAFDAGRYTFSTYSDDGVRLYVDEKRIINSWWPMRGKRNATLSLTEGEHTIRLEYFERKGAALVRLTWKRQ